mgnify:CR=1 FL=1
MSEIVRGRTWNHHDGDCELGLFEAEAKIRSLEVENVEQARLLGLSGNNEAALLSKICVLEERNRGLVKALEKIASYSIMSDPYSRDVSTLAKEAIAKSTDGGGGKKG